MIDFLDMGKNSPYIWTCFTLTFVVLMIIAMGTRRQRRRVVASVKRQAQIDASAVDKPNSQIVE